MTPRHSTRLSQANDGEPEDEQDGQHLASASYPELGTVLTDRPDPGRVITVIGSRRTAEAYDAGHDARNSGYNGGEGDLGMYWAEPGEQQWARDNLGPQEEAPPPPWAQSPVLARLEAMQEAQSFFGMSHHATDINGTHVDDAGDAPEHGTVPRAEDPDGYDDESEEGEGDDRWNEPLPPEQGGHKKEENAATVGMYPEGISSGNGPGLPIGAFTAHSHHITNSAELEDHLREHGLGDEDLQHLRLSAWHTHNTELQEAHRRVSQGRPWNDWSGETVLAHGRLTTPGELEGHLHEQHGITSRGNAPYELAAAHQMDHSRSPEGGPQHPDAGHGRIRQPDPYADFYGDEDDDQEPWELSDDAASYHGHSWDLDPHFGSLHEARVPWTGQERGLLHRWENAPTATWGDFVNSADFPLLDPGEVVHHVEPREGIPPVEAAGDAQWENHLRYGHGWDDARIEQARQSGPFRHVHEALHQLGLPDHRHAGGPEDAREMERRQSEDNMFGPAFPRRTPAQMPLAKPELGGSLRGDPQHAVWGSEAAEPPMTPEYYRQFSPERFKRMMSALNVHVRIDGQELKHDHDDDGPDPGPQQHEHDDPDNSLDNSRTTPDNHPDNQADKNGPEITSGQASGGGLPDTPPVTPPGSRTLPDSSGLSPDDPGHPDNWPQAGADVNETGRAYTQGSDDGKVTRGAPAPAAFSPDDGDSGGGGDQGDAPAEGDRPDDESTPFSKDGALAAFTAAAGNSDFRFEFTGTWHDVMAKARRIRAEGHVRVTHASAGMVIGEVRGDHDTYECGIQRPVGKRLSIQHWACGCPWASFHQKTAMAQSRYAGRPCSHVMALQFEAQSRGMFGRDVSSDEGLPSWSPRTVVVKSWPPYDGAPHRGRWSEEWRAPAMRQPVQGTRRRATPDERRDRDWTPEQRDEWDRASSAPAWRATVALLRAGEDPGAVGALRVMAGASPGLRIACMGNSIAAHGNSGSGDESPDLSFLRWASHLSGGRIRHAGSFSVGGASSSQILASQLASVVAARPDACIIGPWAVNNPVLGVSFERTASDVQNAVLALRVAGIAPLLSLEPPTDDPGRSAFIQGYNTWARRFALHSGVPVADFFGPLSDGRGSWAGGYSADGVHPTAAAARVMGQAVAGLLDRQAGLRATADQANSSWGSQNVSEHPTQKPYGATSPRNWDMDPGSYGPLSGPDPENWGAIDQDSALQMPLTNTAAHQVLVPGAPRPQPGDLHWPSVEGWQQEDQGSFGYTDRANTAGPSTSITPRDPQGIRMEESRRDPERPLPRDPRHPLEPDWGREPLSERRTDQRHDWLAHHLEFEHAFDGFSRDMARQLNGMTGAEASDWHRAIHEHAATEQENAFNQDDSFQWHPGDDDGYGHDPVFGSLTAAGTPYPFRDTVPQLDGALAELKDHPEPALPETTGDDIEATAAADGTIGGGDAGTGQGQGAADDTASLGEFGAARRMLRHHLAGTPMGDLFRETRPQAQEPSPVTQNPGPGSLDEYLTPDDSSIQAMGNQQWSGGGADSDEVTVPAGDSQGGIDDIVAAFQATAAAKGYAGDSRAAVADGDIAGAARAYLSKTADALPQAEADELIREGAGSRARNLDLLRLEGTHYEDADEELGKRGVSLDDYDDDVMFA